MISEQLDVYGNNHFDNHTAHGNSSQISVSDIASMPALLSKKVDPKPKKQFLNERKSKKKSKKVSEVKIIDQMF